MILVIPNLEKNEEMFSFEKMCQHKCWDVMVLSIEILYLHMFINNSHLEQKEEMFSIVS